MFSQFSPRHILNWADEECTHPSRFIRLLHSICRITVITVKEYSKSDLSLRAAALTFTVLLSLVPILAMSTSVIKGLGGGNQLKKAMYSYVDSLDTSSNSPVEHTDPEKKFAEETEARTNITDHLYSAIDQIFDYVDKINFATLGTIGMAGIFVSVVLVLGNIEMAMNAIWNVESGRSILRKIADYLALLVLMPISISLGLAAGAVLKSESLLSQFSIMIPMGWIEPILLKMLPVFFLSLTLYVIYLFFPNTKVKTIPALTGAIFAGFFWFEVQNLYISLQIGVANYNAIYGSFATLPLFLVWIYLGWMFILLGAQVAYAYQHKDSYRIISVHKKPSVKLAVAYDLLDFIYEKFTLEQPAPIDDFNNRYPMHGSSLVEDVADELASHNLIHCPENSLSFMPSLPKEKLSNEKIIQAILGMTFSETKGGDCSRQALHAAASQNLAQDLDAQVHE